MKIQIDESELRIVLEALEDSIEDVRQLYETDWRHGLPTRKNQLDRMKASLDNHEAAITLCKQALVNHFKE